MASRQFAIGVLYMDAMISKLFIGTKCFNMYVQRIERNLPHCGGVDILVFSNAVAKYASQPVTILFYHNGGIGVNCNFLEEEVIASNLATILTDITKAEFIQTCEKSMSDSVFVEKYFIEAYQSRIPRKVYVDAGIFDMAGGEIPGFFAGDDPIVGRRTFDKNNLFDTLPMAVDHGLKYLDAAQSRTIAELNYLSGQLLAQTYERGELVCIKTTNTI